MGNPFEGNTLPALHVGPRSYCKSVTTMPAGRRDI
jgi:hypothetical protein